MEGVAVKPASGSQFGSRLDDAGHDHSDDEIALPARCGVEDGIQAQVAQATENGGDMAVRERAGDAEGIGQRSRGSSRRTSQGRAEGFNLLRGEMSEIGEGARLDFAVLAVGFAEEYGGRGLAVGYGGDVHAYIICYDRRQYKHKIALIHAYNMGSQNRLAPSKQRNFVPNGLELRLRLRGYGRFRL